MKRQSIRVKIKKNKFGVSTLVFLFLMIAACVSGCGKNFETEESILKELKNKNGYIRTVAVEEYKFFEKLVDRDLPENLSGTELEQKTKEKINRVNAEFMLANHMGLCNPYSFESFQRDMEIENSQRKLKKERNEVFYGPEQFDLITYYNYISGNLKLDMVSFITQNADSEVMNGAEDYYKNNKEKYKAIKEIKYLLTEAGQTTECILSSKEMSSLEKTDSILFEFLYNGKTSDTMEYLHDNNLRTVQIISVEYEEQSFKNNIERVVRDYITLIYLEEWLHNIEVNYPVEFNLS